MAGGADKLIQDTQQQPSGTGGKPAAPAPQGGGHGIASGHNKGGTLPGGGPGAGLGSIGTGGASTGGAPTGAVKRGGR
jgi:hypothetical protein